MGPTATVEPDSPARGLELRGHTRVESTGEKIYWSSLGSDFLETCSRAGGIICAPGMDTGHSSTSWLPHGK